MLNKLIHNLKQFAGDLTVLKPAILIPQEKINSALVELIADIPQIKALKFKIYPIFATLQAEISYYFLFTASFDIEPVSIKMSDNVLLITLKRISPIRFRSSNLPKQLLLRGFSFLTVQLLKMDLIKLLSEKFSELDLQENLIILKVDVDELIESKTIPKSTKWLSTALKPQQIEFVDSGVRIQFKVLSQFLEKDR